MPQQKSSQLSRAYAWFSAIATEDCELLAELMAHGVPIDTAHPLRHSTALMEATLQGRAGLVQWLIEHGAAPDFLCGQPLGTALHGALRRKHWDIATLLARAMPSCAIIDAYGATPLHALCSEASRSSDNSITLGLATIFIAKNCPLDALDQEGTAALHHCVINDLHALARLLLQHRANPNALIPDSQVSPLMIAALEKNAPMAKLLLQYGADAQLRTRDGSCPASVFPEIAPLISAEQLARGTYVAAPASDGAPL
jgi:ankyrin repeat protein